jgi:hypothetical protein
MRISQLSATVFLVLVVIIGAPMLYFLVILDHENEPFCQALVLVGMVSWLDEKKTDALPNVGGRSADSLAALRNELGDQPWAETYRYVPGLQKGDPGDLVLMYMARPTRYIMHGEPQTIFADRRWMIVPLDFAGRGGGIGQNISRDVPYGGEASERVTIEEFRARLKKTLEFLRANERPNWQTVVEENEKFLESIGTEGEGK